MHKNAFYCIWVLEQEGWEYKEFGSACKLHRATRAAPCATQEWHRPNGLVPAGGAGTASQRMMRRWSWKLHACTNNQADRKNNRIKVRRQIYNNACRQAVGPPSEAALHCAAVGFVRWLMQCCTSAAGSRGPAVWPPLRRSIKPARSLTDCVRRAGRRGLGRTKTVLSHRHDGACRAALIAVEAVVVSGGPAVGGGVPLGHGVLHLQSGGQRSAACVGAQQARARPEPMSCAAWDACLHAACLIASTSP